MNKYNVTIESKEYNPISHKYELKQFTGEFEAKSERSVKTKAKRVYAELLDTESSEINVIKVELM
jgi:hypothetical protein